MRYLNGTPLFDSPTLERFEFGFVTTVTLVRERSHFPVVSCYSPVLVWSYASSCFVSCLLSLTDRLGFETRNYCVTLAWFFILGSGKSPKRNNHLPYVLRPGTRGYLIPNLILNFILQVLPCKWWNPAYHCWSNSSIQYGKLWQQKRCGVVSTDPSPQKNKQIHK